MYSPLISVMNVWDRNMIVGKCSVGDVLLSDNFTPFKEV